MGIRVRLRKVPWWSMALRHLNFWSPEHPMNRAFRDTPLHTPIRAYWDNSLYYSKHSSQWDSEIFKWAVFISLHVDVDTRAQRERGRKPTNIRTHVEGHKHEVVKFEPTLFTGCFAVCSRTVASRRGDGTSSARMLHVMHVVRLHSRT